MPDSVEDWVIVGIVYVGKTVGNNILLNSCTNVHVLSIPAVVPEGRPPTVYAVVKLGSRLLL